MLILMFVTNSYSKLKVSFPIVICQSLHSALMLLRYGNNLTSPLQILKLFTAIIFSILRTLISRFVLLGMFKVRRLVPESGTTDTASVPGVPG